MKRRSDRAKLTVFVVLLVLFLAAMAKLVGLRLNRGDIYSPYSTLRSDPMGSRALYESLDRLPELGVSRNYLQLTQAELPAGSVLFFLGAERRYPLSMDEFEYAVFDEFIKQGGRVVISLAPARTEIVGGMNPRPPPGMLSQFAQQDILSRLKLELEYRGLGKDEFKDTYVPGTAVGTRREYGLKPVSWHSAYVFKTPGDGWQTILTREGQPVLIARQLGQGSLVVSTDSFFLSNEALRREPQPELLSWLLAAKRTVVFDEYHLDARVSPGIASLAQRYGIMTLIVGLALLALLFIWRNSMPLVPPSRTWGLTLRDRTAAGKTAAAGFIFLLRQNVSPKVLLRECFAAWERTAGKTRQLPQDIDAGIRRLVDDDEVNRDPKLIVEAYQRICDYLDKRKG